MFLVFTPEKTKKPLVGNSSNNLFAYQVKYFKQFRVQMQTDDRFSGTAVHCGMYSSYFHFIKYLYIHIIDFYPKLRTGNQSCSTAFNLSTGCYTFCSIDVLRPATSVQKQLSTTDQNISSETIRKNFIGQTTVAKIQSFKK